MKEMKARLEGKARFRCPFFSPLACEHRSIASLHPGGEKRRPQICHLLSVSAGYLASGSNAMIN